MSEKILLIGDSITEGFNVKKLLPEFNIINKGISGDNSEGVLDRLKRDVLSEIPDKVFVLIGTNDLAQNFSDEEILKNISDIIAELSALMMSNRIYFTSILPTRDDLPRPNERIRNLNRDIKIISEKTGVNFFDLFSEFADDSGNLAAEFTDDGLHLTDEAYKKWAEILRNLLKG